MSLLLSIEVFDNSGVCMVLLCVVGFVEDEKVDPIHGDEGVVQALAKHVSGTDNDHVLREVLLPELLAPEITAHISTEHIHRLVEVGFEDCVLLED
jgi:hypothetical protein